MGNCSNGKPAISKGYCFLNALFRTNYTSWLMDTQGNKAAHVLVSEIKVAAARLQTSVLDRAIQVYGAKGLTPDTPLSYLWTWGRALRFIDGPDEVHLRGIARHELKKAKARHEG